MKKISLLLILIFQAPAFAAESSFVKALRDINMGFGMNLQTCVSNSAETFVARNKIFDDAIKQGIDLLCQGIVPKSSTRLGFKKTGITK